MLLTDILIQKPWAFRDEKTGAEMIYNEAEQRWMEKDAGNKFMIGKIEAQAWLALYQRKFSFDAPHQHVTSTFI